MSPPDGFSKVGEIDVHRSSEAHIPPRRAEVAAPAGNELALSVTKGKRAARKTVTRKIWIGAHLFKKVG